VSAAEERLANDPSSELWGEHRSRYRFAVEGSGVRGQGSGLVVLDVASGAGFGLEMLRQAGACAIGVDYDAGTLADVRRRLRASRLVRGDATCLPLKDASIDLVVSFETIEHVPDAEALVLEIRRVLKPGGRLVLSTPNRDFGPPERHTGNPFHIREFTADELRDLLRASFENVQLFGQRPSDAYRYVPFLMLARQNNDPSALGWKLLVRLPFGLRNRLAVALSGRPFYPGEDDYRFVPEACAGAHALVAVAR
jgi:ubiquinone/menaquinone biosynthesis C-methylase UbiE